MIQILASPCKTLGNIAEYLDKQYPDTRRSLLHGDKNADLNQIFTMLFSTLDSIGQA